MSAKGLRVARRVLLTISCSFSLVVLGAAASLINLTLQGQFYFNFNALAIASASIHLLTVPVMLIVDALRTGAFTSWVIVELTWLSVLWIMWLSTGADTAFVFSNTIFSNGCNYANSKIQTACNEFPTIIAFSFLIWIILMAYTITLLVFAIIGANKGRKTWTSSVKEADFLTMEPSEKTELDYAPTVAPVQAFVVQPQQQQQQAYSPYPVNATPPPTQPYSPGQAGPGYPPHSTPPPVHTQGGVSMGSPALQPSMIPPQPSSPGFSQHSATYVPQQQPAMNQQGYPQV